MNGDQIRQKTPDSMWNLRARAGAGAGAGELELET